MTDGEGETPSAGWGLWVALAACLVFGLPSLVWPAARDQGIEGTTAMLMTWGYVPYRDVWSHSPPGGFTLMGLGFLVFGPTPLAIRLTDQLWLGLGVLAMARLVGRHHGPVAAALAGTTLVLSYYGHGNFWHTAQRDGFMIAPSLLALDFADRAGRLGDAEVSRAGRLALVAGVFVGIASSFKPGGVLVVLPVVVALGRRPKLWLWSVGGGAVVAAIAGAMLGVSGALGPMIETVVGFNRGYAAHYAALAPRRTHALLRGVSGLFVQRPELALAPLGLLAPGRLRLVGHLLRRRNGLARVAGRAVPVSLLAAAGSVGLVGGGGSHRASRHAHALGQTRGRARVVDGRDRGRDDRRRGPGRRGVVFPRIRRAATLDRLDVRRSLRRRLRGSGRIRAGGPSDCDRVHARRPRPHLGQRPANIAAGSKSSRRPLPRLLPSVRALGRPSRPRRLRPSTPPTSSSLRRRTDG